ncbi:hypothetical protein C8R43DRAFT_1139965 [Mycena crocata]|nr:hypothetical protein C8R43DRAFT_1139965 [Mycena crocata]
MYLPATSTANFAILPAQHRVSYTRSVSTIYGTLAAPRLQHGRPRHSDRRIARLYLRDFAAFLDKNTPAASSPPKTPRLTLQAQADSIKHAILALALVIKLASPRLIPKAPAALAPLAANLNFYKLTRPYWGFLVTRSSSQYAHLQ